MSILKRGPIALFIVLLWAGCTKPTQNIKIVVDTNVIKFSALIHITDAANNSNPPPSLTMTLSGQDADSIYEISGKKNFTVTNGIISLGPTPNLVPTTDRPVKFNVVLTAPGYTSVTQAIQINAGETQQVVSIVMAKTNTSGGGVTITPVTPVTAPPSTTPVSLSFRGTCAHKADFELRPSIYIFYRITGSSTGYQYLGYMDKGELMASLVMGRSYDFELTYNGITYSITQKIDLTSYSETIDMGDVCNTF